MKKLMISAIILLPLLILIIMLVSGAIMSLVTHIYVESVEFVDDDTLVLVLSDEQAPPFAKCEVTILPLKASNRDIIFASDDESVATIDINGVVTAKYFGETYVSVASKENRAAVAKRKVLVTDNRVHAIEIQPFEDNLYNKETLRLTAKVLPEEANDQSVEWSSSNPAVLSVSQTGEAVCHGAGEVTVTARSTERRDVQDSVTIHCFQRLDGISLEGGLTEYTVPDREAQFPTVIPTPSDATYTVEYTTSDESVATVDENGKITFKKVGYAEITATASDVKGDTYTAKVSYNCTDGYFEMGALLDKTEYTFDYDAALNKPLDIKLNIRPDVAYREIVDVSFKHDGKTYNSKDGEAFPLIAFDGTANVFRLDKVDDDYPLGAVEITIHAKKYSVAKKQLIDTETDKCTVNVTRKTKSITFIDRTGKTPGQTVNSGSLTFAEATKAGGVSSGIGVVLAPANHTDDYLLSVISGDATVSENQYLTFAKEGEATVKAYIEGTDVNAKLTLSYVAPKRQEKRVEVSVDNAPSNVCLNFTDSGADTCYLDIKPPAGKEAKYESNNKDVVDFEEGTVRLVAKKGGFATVTVRFVPIQAAIAYTAERGDDEVILKIYVDKPVANTDVVITPALERTQNDSVGYTVRFLVAPDAMEGKEVYIDGVKATANGGNVLEYVGSHNFTKNMENIAVSVRYAAKVKDYAPEKTGEIFFKTHLAETTRGALKNAPTLTLDGKPFDGDISFGNIGDAITLDIEAALDPLDFTFDEKKIFFSEGGNIDRFAFQVTVKDSTHASVTLTAKKPLGAPSAYYLNIAGHTFPLNVKIDAVADKIELSFGGKPLLNGGSYNTLLRELAFNAKISRADGEPVTVKDFTYTFGDVEATSFTELTHTITHTLTSGKNATLTVSAGKAEFTLTVRRVPLSELTFDKFYLQKLSNEEEPVKDLKDLSIEETFNIILTKSFQGSFDICVDIPRLTGDNVLEGFDLEELDEEDKKLFSVVCPIDEQDWSWTSELRVSDRTVKYAVTVKRPQNELNFVDKVVAFTCNGRTVRLSLNLVSIARLDFDGFNIGDKANGGDVYKGYQQARVFAKHSDYGNEDGAADYFRMPVTALSDVTDETTALDLSLLTWTLTKYAYGSGAQASETLVTQRGDKVYIFENGKISKTYAITRGDGSSTLMDDNEQPVAQGGKYVVQYAEQVPWIDIYAGSGAVDIYFGNFVGLSEVDVQNDFFGNFGEKEGWELPYQEGQKDIKGEEVTPSDGAFSYLRIQAGDGAEGGKSTHFNFNVLEDGELVNIFDANGYYDNDSVVLHTNLYGPEEIDDAEPNTVLTGTKNISKTLVYGNGYHINLMARNSELIKTAIEKDDTKRLGYHNGASFQSIYNLVLMGSNPTTEIKPLNQAMVFRIRNAYYCDIQYLAKINTFFDDSVSDTYRGSDFSYIKNSVIRYASRSGYQLSYEGDKSYFENVVFIESVAAITMENKANMTCYFNGFFDILNYSSPLQLCNTLGQQAGMAYDLVISAEKYCEWFGKTNKGLSDVNDALSNRYVNPTVMNVATYPTNKVYFRHGDSYEENNGILAQKLTIIFFPAWVYDRDVSFDGGIKVGGYYTDRDMSKLFDSPDDIRLLCQYKYVDADGTLVKNTDHIRWHMEKVYRDFSVIGERESHIDNLKETLKGTTWADGSGVNAWGEPFAPAAATNLLASALPSKKRITA